MYITQMTIEQEDLDANARLFQQQQQTSVPLLQRFTAETNRELLTPEKYRAAIRASRDRKWQMTPVSSYDNLREGGTEVKH